MNRTAPSSKRWQPLDRTALVVVAVLGVLIVLLLMLGDRTAPRIRDFNWRGRQIGAEDTAFVLTFSRPMDHASVENNLRLEPPLPGKVSWAGRRMAYTLDAPAPYGTEFELRLQGSRDRFSQPDGARTQMSAFTADFRTRDRAFVYLGVEGSEEGRLVLYNLTRQEKQVLTPERLVVMDFQPYPLGDRILFSATDQNSQRQGLLNQELYSVTTGIPVNPPPALDETRRFSLLPSRSEPITQPPGKIEQLLDSRDYQNLKFDLSSDGNTVVIQRVNRANPADFGLWVLRPGQPPQPLESEPGGDFLIAPDGDSLAVAQGEGLALLPLESQSDALDFLPRYGMVLSFARDGSAAAMVQFNADDPGNPSRSLYLVTNQGKEEELLRTSGSILSAQFDPAKQRMYGLITKLLPGEEYVEQPYLTSIDLTTSETRDLLLLPIQRDIQMSLAPDGLGILFDQVVSAEDAADGRVRGSDGKAIANSRLWFLPLVVGNDGELVRSQPEPLPLAGLRPRWLP